MVYKFSFFILVCFESFSLLFIYLFVCSKAEEQIENTNEYKKTTRKTAESLRGTNCMGNKHLVSMARWQGSQCVFFFCLLLDRKPGNS